MRKKNHRNQEDQADYIFTHDFKHRKPGAFDITGRKISAEYQSNEGCGHEKKTPEGNSDIHPTDEQKRGDKKSNRLKIPGCNPELGWQVCIIPGKDIHPFEREGMQKIDRTDKKECNTDTDQKSIINFIPAVPGDDKYYPGYDNTEELSKGMKQEITIRHSQGYPDDEYQEGENKY